MRRRKKYELRENLLAISPCLSPSRWLVNNPVAPMRKSIQEFTVHNKKTVSKTVLMYNRFVGTILFTEEYKLGFWKVEHKILASNLFILFTFLLKSSGEFRL